MPKESESTEEKLARLMNVFFRRKFMYDKMRKEGTVISILKKQRELVSKIINDLNKLGFDPEAYVESDKGSVEYFTFCTDEEHRDEIIHKCQRCYNYCPHADTLCIIHGDELMVICGDFKDTGYDLWDRVQMFEILRCSKCSHHYQEDEVNRCHLKLNMMLPACPSYDGPEDPPKPKASTAPDSV
jgi:hypothetical protein